MNKEEAQNTLANLKRYMSGGGAVDMVANKAIDIAIEALGAQPEPCEDAVNRETLLKFFDGWMSALDENCHNQSVSDLKIIKRDFANLPSVTPKQRTGKWIPQDYNKRVRNISTCVYYYPTCSECGQVGNETYKYCPHCGAKMEGANNETD